jgi:hypothetical protein
MIKRIKDYSKREPSKSANKIYIVCEGRGTEPDYFRFFEGLSSNLELIVIPPEDGTDPQKLMGLAKRVLLGETRKYTVDYLQKDKVWFAIDTDSWEKEGKIAPLRDFCSKMNNEITAEYSEVKPYTAWNVAQSNPCFEVWLYYHYYDDVPEMEDVKKYPSLKSYVNDQIAGGFDYQRDQVRLQSAIDNSERNYKCQQSNGNPDWFSTEQYLLGKEIMGFVEAEIHKLRNKMG